MQVFDAISCRFIGRIYQTSRGVQQSPDYLQNGGLQAQATLCRSINSKTTPLPPSSYRQSFANYQNCTIVQSHLPHSNYGTYVSLAPKILIFPVFVQVCSVSVYLPSLLCSLCTCFIWNIHARGKRSVVCVIKCIIQVLSITNINYWLKYVWVYK